jgi:hypothetical protein
MVGTETDQAIGKFIFDFLYQTFRQLWNEALRARRYPIQDRHIYMKGLFYGVWNRLKKEKAAQNQERAVMVIANKLAQRNKYMDGLDLTEGKGEHVNEGSSGAFAEGYQKGEALQIRKGVEQPARVNKGELA